MQDCRELVALRKEKSELLRRNKHLAGRAEMFRSKYVQARVAAAEYRLELHELQKNRRAVRPSEAVRQLEERAYEAENRLSELGEE